MTKIKKSIKQNSFIGCEDVEKNSAVYNFNDNSLKLGKVDLTQNNLKGYPFFLPTI